MKTSKTKLQGATAVVLHAVVRRRCPICGKTKCKKGMMELDGIVPMEAAKILHDL
jgi:hypothetical protein